jgi:anthranilate synthase component 1
MIAPTRAEFRALAAGGRLVPVQREVRADHETPVSAFRKIDDGAHAFLLESVERDERWGRLSLIGSRPALVFVARGGRCELHVGGRAHPCERPPAVELADLLARRQAVALPGLPRFCGGAVGYLGPGAARWFERLPADPREDPGLPDAVFLFTDVVGVFDHLAHTFRVVTHARGGDDPDAAWEAAVARLEAEVGRLALAAAWPAPAGGEAPETPASSWPQEGFLAAAARARDHLRAGDVLQITLSQPLSVPVRRPAFEAYRALRVTGPSPCMYFLRLGDLCLAGAAPGTLVRRTGDLVEVHPLTGTRPRGRTTDEDQRLEEELRAGEAERAGHVTLVDLGRSDVGRVAQFGTVETREWMVVERHSGVMQLASTIRGRARPDAGPLDLARACLPASDASGVPRRRALELIQELEPVRRGISGGAVGYFDLRGDCDLCSASRTLAYSGGRAHWSATAMIAGDVEPETAWQEARSQERPLWLAVQQAERGGP